MTARVSRATACVSGARRASLMDAAERRDRLALIARRRGARRHSPTTEELKRLHEYFSQTKYLVWDATRFQPKPLDSTGLGLDKLQVQWIEIRRKLFDANQMFKQKNPTPSSADQAEFVANFYERMLEEGQGVGVKEK